MGFGVRVEGLVFGSGRGLGVTLAPKVARGREVTISDSSVS